MSDEDADIKAVVAHWIVNNVKPENQKLIMQNIEDYFYKGIWVMGIITTHKSYCNCIIAASWLLGLRWVSQQADSGLPLPIISVVKNTLAQLRDRKSVV